MLAAGFLPLGVSPRRLEVLTTTTRLGLTFTTTIGVIDRVHTHSTNGRALALPASPTGLPRNLVHVIAITDSADGCVALLVKFTKLT